MTTTPTIPQRRVFLKSLLRTSAFGLVACNSGSVFADAFDSAALLDSVYEKPMKKGTILATAEIGVGSPVKYIPRSAMLETALDTSNYGNSYGVQVWGQLLASLQNADPMTQIGMVHHFFNQVRYVGEQPGQDFWKMPEQFLAEGGDCEDYAIAKFISLRLLNFHPDRLRVLFVDNTLTGIQHAVTAVYYNREIYLLDNMLSNVSLCNNLTNYSPICSFDEKRLWLHWSPGKPSGTVASLQQRLGKQG